MLNLKQVAVAVSAAALLAGCLESSPAMVDVSEVPLVPGDAAIKRLTQVQYENTIEDLVGDDIIVPASIEPDLPSDGLISIGSARTTISPLGVEKYESAAYAIAQQMTVSDAVMKRVVPCEWGGPNDTGCMQEFVESFGRRAWRRPLTEDETASLMAAATSGTTGLGTFAAGVEMAMAAILQSPNFLFRVELGEADPTSAGQNRYTAYEMATRLGYFFTNSTPDDALLDAAESGALLNEAGVRAQAQRLLDSPRARDAVRNFFAEYFELHNLDHLSKDSIVFVHMDKDLGPDAREETLRVVERIVFDNEDYLNLFTTRETYVNRRLASLYGIPAPVTEGFGAVTLPVDGGRRGLLGMASILALQSHPIATSAVLRGRFVRTKLLCGTIPPPPTGVNTGIPEADANARTLRERSKVHQEEPVCANCHALMDPIGLGLENFDSIGRWRTHDNGALIDPSGFIDDYEFMDAWDLGRLMAEHPDSPGCLVKNIYRYATGSVEEFGELEAIEALIENFKISGHRVQPLMVEIAASPGFRKVREIENE